MAPSLPSPPFVDIPGIHNFRGIGGDHVGPGLVYRSADPTRATRTGLEKMSKDLGKVGQRIPEISVVLMVTEIVTIGIRVVFDLRSEPEIKRDGPEWAGVAVDDPGIFEKYGIRREWVPVFATKDYGPEQVTLRYKNYTNKGSEGFVLAYHDILLAGTDSYGKILRHLAQEKPAPCLVHCTAGKDRTGVFVALLFMLAGAPDDEIAKEYSLTDLGLAELKPLFTERLLKNPALGGDEEGVANMVSSKQENMLATLQMIRREFISAENYMKESCGLQDEEVQRIRKNIVEGALVNM